jgi:signal recognition particle subunit SEC65
MSWEEMYCRDYPCSCGKGTYTEVVEMDDWNRRREHRTINCPECAENEKIAKINEVKEKERLKKLDEEIKTYFRELYMEKWLSYFDSAKNKKEIWTLAKEIGIEKDSLSSFYSRNKSINMEEYVRNLAISNNIQKIMQVLNIGDKDLTYKVDEAMKLKKAEYARLVADWHRNH